MNLRVVIYRFLAHIIVYQCTVLLTSNIANASTVDSTPRQNVNSSGAGWTIEGASLCNVTGCSAALPIHDVDATSPAKSRRDGVISEIREENDWKNDLVLLFLPAAVRARIPRLLQLWLRNYIATVAMYLGLGGVWAYYIYICFGQDLFPRGNKPSLSAMFDQIKIAMAAAPLYAMLPVVVELLVEAGLTRVYSRVSDVGLTAYLGYFVLYMVLVEIGVYCMHRGLHDFRPGYRYLHHIHHKYNKENTMSPFAGLAFHPLDGILQAFPYVVMLFVVPMHFLTHELLLFATGVWTNNIHDCLHSGLMPIMGAGYHTIHHTTYKHNYGEYTIYMDWLCGTLVHPEEYEASLKAAARTQNGQSSARGEGISKD